tara:strand:+ start:3002 stop:3823 length:822 start_codon:yes stop_codon:yes gene_type:complete
MPRLAHDPESAEFTFDLRKAMLGGETSAAAGEKGSVSDENAYRDCSGVLGLSLLLTASYYDAYRSLFSAIGIPYGIQVVGWMDIVLRCSVLVFAWTWLSIIVADGRTKYDTMNGIGVVYYVVLNISLLMYLAERLVGRYRLDDGVTGFDVHLDRFFSSLGNRRSFTGPFSGFIASLIVTAMVASLSATAFYSLCILSDGNEPAAFAFVCCMFASELFYTVARLGRFVAISKQSLNARAVASVHTLFTTSFSTPISILYIVAYNWREAPMAVAT